MLTNDVRTGLIIGAPIGLALSLALFFNVAWYHDFLVWQFSNPFIMIPAFMVGAFIGWTTD
jgi:hypothetical protein